MRVAQGQTRSGPTGTSGYYHAVNLTLFDLAFCRDVWQARARATEVLDLCKKAESNEFARDRKWRIATDGEALLVLGKEEQGDACYSQAADPALEAAARELESMYQQALYLSRLIGNQSMRRELKRIFRQGEE